MKNKYIIALATILQLILGWFLLVFMIFSDSSPNELETFIYLFFALAPQIIGQIIKKKTSSTKKGLFAGIILYAVGAFALPFMTYFDDFYVTGVGGVDFVTSGGVMMIHAALYALLLFVLSRSPEQKKLLFKKQMPIVLLGTCITGLLFGMFHTYLQPVKSYLNVSGYIDVQDILAELPMTTLIGILDIIFIKVKMLFAIAAYTVVFLFIYKKITKNKAKEKTSLAALCLFFIPIWLCVFGYIVVHNQDMKERISLNFENFQFTLDYQSSIKPYHIEIDGSPVIIWCDTKPIVTEQKAQCKDLLTVQKTEEILDKKAIVQETTYPEVGLFEKVIKSSPYPNGDETCVSSESTVHAQDALFFVSTEDCTRSEIPHQASNSWERIVGPLLECFGKETCEVNHWRWR